MNRQATSADGAACMVRRTCRRMQSRNGKTSVQGRNRRTMVVARARLAGSISVIGEWDAAAHVKGQFDLYRRLAEIQLYSVTASQ